MSTPGTSDVLDPDVPRRLQRFRNPFRHKWLRRVGIGFVAVFLVWAIGGYFVIVNPPTDKPQHVDVVLVLGGPLVNGRLQVAQGLIESGYSQNLVVSAPSYRGHYLRQFCADAASNPQIQCFNPNPATTQGEAEEINRLAAQHGWKSVIVVTSAYHVLRAKLLVDRCFKGRVLMVAARHGRTGLRSTAYQYLYQTGAWAKALWNRGC